MINNNAMDIDNQYDREESQYALRCIQKNSFSKYCLTKLLSHDLKDRLFCNEFHKLSFNEASVIDHLWALLRHEVPQVRLAALKVLMRTSCNFPCVIRKVINCNDYSIDSSLLSNVLNLCFPLGYLDMRPSDIPADQRCNISICLSFLQCFLETRPQTISLLSDPLDPLAFYRKCFRYLCHPDFFLRTFHILKLAFEHLKGSTEIIRVQKAVNDFFSHDFFSQRTSAFEEKAWSKAELEQIMTISKETACSLKFVHQLSNRLADSNFWQSPGDSLPRGIPAIWQVYWGNERMLEFLVSTRTLEYPPQDDSSYCDIGTHLSKYVQHDWLRSFLQQFLGRRINIHSMISVTYDNFLVFSPDANEEMNETDFEMNVDAPTNEVEVIHSKAGGPPVYEGQVSMNEVEVEPKAMNEVEIVHSKAGCPLVHNGEINIDGQVSMTKAGGHNGEINIDGQEASNSEVELEVVHPKASGLYVCDDGQNASNSEVEVEVVHPKASGPSVYDDEKEASKDSHKDLRVSNLIPKSFIKRTSNHVSSLINKFEQAVIAPPAIVVP